MPWMDAKKSLGIRLSYYSGSKEAAEAVLLDCGHVTKIVFYGTETSQGCKTQKSINIIWEKEAVYE